MVAALFGAVLAGCDSGGGSPGPRERACARAGVPTTVAYRHVRGVDTDLTSLDVHAPDRACDAPVVVWVHGGGYQTGDKRNQIAAKVRLFNEHGWILVSVNYRLTRPREPGSARFPDHYDDVAAAVAWVHAHVATYGGDASRLALLGHSAGADIVANVVVEPIYLERRGLGLAAMRCAGALDTAGLDKVAADGPGFGGEQRQWRAALGNNPDYRTATSATRLIRRERAIPAIIVVVRGSAPRQAIETAFLDRLQAAGKPTARIDAGSLTHGQVNSLIGARRDAVMTPPLVAFLTRCFEA